MNESYIHIYEPTILYSHTHSHTLSLSFSLTHTFHSYYGIKAFVYKYYTSTYIETISNKYCPGHSCVTLILNSFFSASCHNNAKQNERERKIH